MAEKKHPSYLHSLRTRFIAIVGLTTALCLGASTIITLKLHYQQILGAKREKADVLRNTITQLFARASKSATHREIQGVLQTISGHSDVRSVRLIGDNGRVLFSSHLDEVGLRFIIDQPPSDLATLDSSYRVVDEGVIQHAQRMDDGRVVRRITTIVQRPRDDRLGFLPQILSGQTHRYPRTFSATNSIYDKSTCGGCHQQPKQAVLNIGLSLEETNVSLQMISKRLLLWALITTVLIGAVISLLFSRLVNTPLTHLISTMRTVEMGNLNVRTSLKRRDEIGLLGDKFNTMVERLGMAQDEIQRYHDEQMEQAVRMASVGEMARALAHEIRNPLAGISGAAQVLRKDLEPREPRHRVLTEILEQVDRLARVVSNILRYARSQPLQLMLVPLREVILEALSAFEAQLQEGHIKTVIEEKPDLPPVRVDPNQMHQVFMNLILHARKAMPEGGELRIQVSGGREKDKEVQVVEFHDSGPGLSPGRLEEIFKPFYTKKSGDTGLGLSVAQKIVSLHGGNISAHTKEGLGTFYVVTLPVKGPSNVADSSAEPHRQLREVG